MAGHEADDGDPIEWGKTFALMLTGRLWFEGRVKASEGATFARLMFAAYDRLQKGLLLSKSDAARLMLSEHKTTANHYIDRAERIGFVHVKDSERDGRIKLVVLTEIGMKEVEKEAQRLFQEWKWLPMYMRRDRKALGELRRPDLPKPSEKRPRFEEFELLRGAGHAPEESGVAPDPDALVAAYGETLLYFEENTEALKGRASALLDDDCRVEGKFELALKDAEEAVRLAPTDADALWLRGWARGKVGRTVEGFVDAERALALRDSDWRRAAFAFWLEREGRLEEAIKQVTISMKTMLHSASLVSRAQMYGKLGKVEEALGDLRAAKSLTEDPDDLRRIDKEVRQIEKLRETEPHSTKKKGGASRDRRK